jgi:hypothetical protein
MHYEIRPAMLALLAAGLLLTQGIYAEDKKPKQPEKTKDVVVEGELVNADLKDKVQTQCFCKTFTFKMEKDKSYQIELTSAAFPGVVRLENADGNQIGVDTSRFGAATLFHRPTKTEDHTIVATTQAGGAVGKFTLLVREVKEWDGKPIELKNDNGQGSHTGPLMHSDPMRGGKKHRAFLFEMEKGKTYEIVMSSKAFDSYLFLESPNGNQLAANDDGGGYPTALIVHTATESGKHRIITTYFGGGAGTFNLTIRQK